MKSVLDLKTSEVTNNSLNFTIIGYGESDIINNMITYVENNIKEYILQYSVHIYDTDKLQRIESHPNFLFKTHPLKFSCKKDVHEQCYWGFFNIHDYNKLYNHLFSTKIDDFPPQQVPYYSKITLLNILKNKFGSGSSYSKTITSDIEINYHYEYLSNKIAFTKIDFHLNTPHSEDEREQHIAWFDSCIEYLDLYFLNCFQSAYISFNPSPINISHNALYKNFDPTYLDKYVLGLEWSVYFSQKILCNNDNGGFEKLSDVISLVSLKNGKKYTCITDISSFDNQTRVKINNILNHLLMPGYGTYSWHELCFYENNPEYLPETILVFCDLYDTIPDIIFSYKMNLKEIILNNNLENTPLLDIISLKEKEKTEEKTGDG